MKQVTNDLNNIHNLKHAYIYREGEEGISTFNAEKTPMMQASIELIEQYFMAAEGIEKSYNEMIFPLDNGDNLIAFAADESTLVVLLTEEKINLPMLHMALTVIIKKLNNGTYQKQALRTPSPPESIKKQIQPTPSKAEVTTRTPKTVTPSKLVTPQTSQPETATKKPVTHSLKSLFSNPFSAKKSKSKERPYSNTQSSPKDKKLVYRGVNIKDNA